jgi:hypothetical protein
MKTRTVAALCAAALSIGLLLAGRLGLAQAASPVHGWEYKCVYLPNAAGTGDEMQRQAASMSAELTKAGADGWELVTAGEYQATFWCLKRPKS